MVVFVILTQWLTAFVAAPLKILHFLSALFK
jgi:hypothetical protein